MKISEEEFIDCLEVLDLADKEIIEDGFNARIEESKINFARIPNTQLVMIETFRPRLSADKKKLTFETDDVRYFLENTIGEREQVEIEDGIFSEMNEN